MAGLTEASNAQVASTNFDRFNNKHVNYKSPSLDDLQRALANLYLCAKNLKTSSYHHHPETSPREYNCNLRRTASRQKICAPAMRRIMAREKKKEWIATKNEVERMSYSANRREPFFSSHECIFKHNARVYYAFE
ncbi:hypothetical protein ACS0PU_007691 [Formica fusca]